MPKPPFPAGAVAVAEPAAAGVSIAEFERAPEGVAVAAEATDGVTATEAEPTLAAVAEAELVAEDSAAAEGDPALEAICAFQAATAAGLIAAAGVAGVIREPRVPRALSEGGMALPPAGVAASPGWARP